MQRLLRDIIPHIYSGDETEMYLHAVQMYVRMSDNNTFLFIRYPEIIILILILTTREQLGTLMLLMVILEWYRTLSTEQVIDDLRHCDNDPACRWGDRGDVSKVTFLIIAKLIREQSHSHGLLIHSGASWSVTQAVRYLFWCRKFAREVRRNKKMYNNTIILTRGDKSHVTRVH